MQRVQFAVTGLVVAGLVALSSVNARAEKPADKPKTNKEKIVGIWEFVKSSDPKNAPPPGTTMEFTKDGTLKMVIKLEGKVIPIPDGKYQVDGDTLSVTMTSPDGKVKTEKAKINKLTDTVFVFEDDSKGKKDVIELKKKK